MKTQRRSIIWLAGCWVIWALVLCQQLYVRFILERDAIFSDGANFKRLTFVVILAPWIGTILLRWLVLPRIKTAPVGLLVYMPAVIFAGGFALAMNFLAVPQQHLMVWLGLLGVFEYIPLGLPWTYR